MKFNQEEENQDFGASSLKDAVWNAELQGRKIIINEDIGPSLIEKAVLQIFNINRYDFEQDQVLKEYNPEPILIYLNTNGGTMDEAFSLISAIESSSTPVITYALGKAWSAGFLILLAGHHRVCQKYSSLMLHQGSAGVQGEFNRMIEYAGYYEKCHNQMNKFIMEKTKIKQKKLDQIFHGKSDWYMNAEEALALGVIDEIV